MALESSESNAPPDYEVIEFFFSEIDTDAKLSVFCKGTRLDIYLSEENFTDSPQLKERYLFYLGVADEFELDGLTIEDFYDWIVEPFLPLLRSLPRPDQNKWPTLQDFFKPNTLTYTLKGSASGERVPSPYEVDDGRRVQPGIRLRDELCAPWPRFCLSEIEICAENAETALSRVPRKVRLAADGSAVVFFLKLLHVGDEHRATQELRNYQRIRDAGPGTGTEDLRISRLLGLLQDDKGFLLGLLLSYIDCRARNLWCAAVKPGTTQDVLRRKWADQITSTVHSLHAAGAIWGDAKAENVLIDIHDNAWVADFGGGYTEGWVDKEMAGTVEGDLQGLTKILEHLGV